MTRRLTIALAAFAALAAASAPASAERLVATLSRHQVLVNSNFTGSLIVLFGLAQNWLLSRSERREGRR